MDKLLINLGYKYLSPTQFYKEYENVAITIDLNSCVISVSLDGGTALIKFSSKILNLGEEDEDIFESVIYAKIKCFLNKNETL